jgi:UDP-N-acetylmuramate dehydrogenase
VPVRLDEPLRLHNTLALTATAAAFAEVTDRAALDAALTWARAQGLRVLPLGEGSNVVLASRVEQLVVKMASRGREVLAADEEAVRLRVAAGENWHELVSWCLAQGFHGLENLALIPGTAGAAPVQNIGAYGVELSEFLVAVEAVDLESGASLRLAAQECLFGYRDSAFKHAWRDRLVITAIELCLPRRRPARADYPSLAAALAGQGGEVTPARIFDAVVAIRRARLPDPRQLPNAGSFFKNPVVEEALAAALRERYPALPFYPAAPGWVKLPAAFLIDACGFRGWREDGVGVHREHALVLVNEGGNSGLALLRLAARIQQAVAQRFAVALEIEPRVYGEAA